ncbi:MAG: class I SAM-dependent methyltransferase [Betaproteobacteria bacterium]|nr:class I SAM-dependent methyltransferase [Betaproteobacteria bacterium]NBY04649.1 class I SAM-dependent methyltransferase [Betaproteobacteria bacterium]
MGDYTNMSAYYDVIMTSGYYDYDQIVTQLMQQADFRHVLEIGCGTGLIMEALAKRRPDVEIAGIDLTQAMLNIAQERLKGFPNVSLARENVTQMQLSHPYEVAFSYGGVWYFVFDGDKEPFMVSHIPDELGNLEGLARVAAHITPGGQLLLGIQGPHHDYQKPISNGMIYGQQIDPHPDGFIKHYYLDDGPHRVMAQTVQYRTYNFAQALTMLENVGLRFLNPSRTGHQFLAFVKSNP